MAGVTPGSVPVDPPPPGDPASLATTPAPGQTHDIVLGGVGFTLYRDADDSMPNKGYGSRPVDYSYSPVFVERANTSGDMGDDQQDFFMTWKQRDWSAGEGRKFFPQEGDAFWNGSGIQPTALPGEVKPTGKVSHQSLPSVVAGAWGGATDNVFSNGAWVKQTGQVANSTLPDAIFIVEGDGTNSVQARYSTDGGGTWTLQNVTAGATQEVWKDCIDMCVGDDGYIYCLEGSSTATQSQIHRIQGPTTATVGWDNWTTMTLRANCICYYNGGVYIADSAGKFCLTVTGGTKTTIKDFTNGNAGIKILQLLSTPQGIYIMTIQASGVYKIYLYNGGDPQQLMQLPAGWRSQAFTESGLWLTGGDSSYFAQSQDFMAWSEGVLYITGLMPARDLRHSRRRETPYHTALYYYASGNSGLIWQAEQSMLPWQWGGAGSVSLIHGGIVAFTDFPNDCVMAYDPRTGGVWRLAQGIDRSDYFDINVSGAAGNTITTAQASATGTTVSISNGLNTPVGSLLRNGSASSSAGKERVERVLPASGYYGGNNLTVIRGYHETASLTATFSTTGETIIAIPPMLTPSRTIFDPVNGVLHFVTAKIPPSLYLASLYRHNAIARVELQALDQGSNAYASGTIYKGLSWVQSSGFDFNSALNKYFRTIQVDGDLTQFADRTDEVSGLMHVWYKTDSPSVGIGDRFKMGTDLTPINATTTTVATGSASGETLVLAAGHGAVVGSLLYDVNDVDIKEVAVVKTVSGNTVTVKRHIFSGGDGESSTSFWPQIDYAGNCFATGDTINVVSPLTPGTRYNLNVTARLLYLTVLLLPGLATTAQPLSAGPVLRKITVRGVPIQTGYRKREYSISMFNNQNRLSEDPTSPQEARTPAQMRLALDTLIQAAAPVTVSDSSMSSVTCVFVPEQCIVREIRPAEYVAYVTLREI